jgi:hypothetical protein
MAAGHGAVLARRQHIRVHPTVAVVIRDLTRELGVQREARPGERPKAELSHQSRAMNPPDLPEAAQATPVRSITVTATPRRDRK